MIYLQWPSKFGLSDRHLGRREHDRQRCYAGDAVVGGAKGHGYDIAIISGLVGWQQH
jgi:hypothetical protein